MAKCPEVVIFDLFPQPEGDGRWCKLACPGCVNAGKNFYGPETQPPFSVPPDILVNALAAKGLIGPGGATSVRIAGNNEPTDHPWFADYLLNMYTRVTSRGAELMVITNGVMLRRSETYAAAMECGLDGNGLEGRPGLKIIFSLDGNHRAGYMRAGFGKELPYEVLVSRIVSYVKRYPINKGINFVVPEYDRSRQSNSVDRWCGEYGVPRELVGVITLGRYSRKQPELSHAQSLIGLRRQPTTSSGDQGHSYAFIGPDSGGRWRVANSITDFSDDLDHQPTFGKWLSGF